MYLTARHEAAGQRYRQTTQFWDLGGLIDASADSMPDVIRRVRLAWACYSRFKRELHDMEDAPFALKLPMLMAEVMETLQYGCVTWTFGKEHFAELRTAHHKFLVRTIGFQRRQRTDHLMSYAKVFKKTQCESVETISANGVSSSRGPYNGRTMSD